MLRAAITALTLAACHPPPAEAPGDEPPAATPVEAPPIDRDPELAIDAVDRCPDQAENHNGIADDDGCPDLLPEDLAAITGAIGGLAFATNKDQIVQGREVLTSIAAVLQRYPEVRVEIRGHVAARDEYYRVDLSSRRAEAIRRYLVAQGVAADRLIARGYGAERPIGDPKTAAGRRLNARIELEVLTQ